MKRITENGKSRLGKKMVVVAVATLVAVPLFRICDLTFTHQPRSISHALEIFKLAFVPGAIAPTFFSLAQKLGIRTSLGAETGVSHPGFNHAAKNYKHMNEGFGAMSTMGPVSEVVRFRGMTRAAIETLESFLGAVGRGAADFDGISEYTKDFAIDTGGLGNFFARVEAGPLTASNSTVDARAANLDKYVRLHFAPNSSDLVDPSTATENVVVIQCAGTGNYDYANSTGSGLFSASLNPGGLMKTGSVNTTHATEGGHSRMDRMPSVDITGSYFADSTKRVVNVIVTTRQSYAGGSTFGGGGTNSNFTGGMAPMDMSTEYGELRDLTTGISKLKIQAKFGGSTGIALTAKGKFKEDKSTPTGEWTITKEPLTGFSSATKITAFSNTYVYNVDNGQLTATSAPTYTPPTFSVPPNQWNDMGGSSGGSAVYDTGSGRPLYQNCGADPGRSGSSASTDFMKKVYGTGHSYNLKTGDIF